MRRAPAWFAKEYHVVQIGSIDGTDTVPHDRGLIRALRSHYDAEEDPNVVGDPRLTVFVGRLSYDTNDDSLASFFERYGRIKRVRVVRDVVTGASKGYGFVEFESERSFADAFRWGNRAMLDGRQILVDCERERRMTGWVPRRLGGGLGGRKESGQLRFGGRDRPFRVPLSMVEEVLARHQTNARGGGVGRDSGEGFGRGGSAETRGWSSDGRGGRREGSGERAHREQRDADRRDAVCGRRGGRGEGPRRSRSRERREELQRRGVDEERRGGERRGGRRRSRSAERHRHHSRDRGSASPDRGRSRPGLPGRGRSRGRSRPGSPGRGRSRGLSRDRW